MIRQLSPTQTVVGSFALVISLGTVLLALPAASSTGEGLRLVDAFFTAVSSTCVTGLIVVDTGTDLSLFGQIVVLTCIQIGGLGLMAFTTIFLIATGRRLAIGDRAVLVSSFHHSPTAGIGGLLKYIVLATFAIESVGFALLAIRWVGDDRFAGPGQALYHALFHAVSAFCNAGFSLNADSLVGFQADAHVQLVVAALVIVGGLGFLVGLDVVQASMGRVRRRPPAGYPPRRLSTHSRLVLLMTAVLLVTGTVAFYVLERDGVLGGMTAGTAWLNAFFSAVTPRTAGFNTVDFAQLGSAALILTLVLMFIGGSPGSAAGGVKTSTFGLLLAFAASRLRGHTRLHLWNRTIPQESVDKAGSVVVAASALVVVATAVLMTTETHGLPAAESQAWFVPLLFETVSAFGTVGLSMGATAGLSDAGKVVICAAMFMGRVGPLTLALAIARRRARAQYRYAEENVMVG